MTMTRAQKRDLVEEALRDHLPWDGVDAEGKPTPDTRSLRDLRILFERRHLGGLVRSYATAKAARAQEEFDIADIDSTV